MLPSQFSCTGPCPFKISGKYPITSLLCDRLRPPFLLMLILDCVLVCCGGVAPSEVSGADLRSAWHCFCLCPSPRRYGSFVTHICGCFPIVGDCRQKRPKIVVQRGSGTNFFFLVPEVQFPSGFEFFLTHRSTRFRIVGVVSSLDVRPCF